MNKSLQTLVVSLILLTASSWAADPVDSTGDTLSGVLSSDVTPGVRPILVVGKLYVPPGATVTIAKGTVLLFESFAGLHVQGTLVARGTSSQPVVFTSKNDKDWNSAASVNAAQFDWNGIDIDEAAFGTEFSECIIRYSVYGIKSQTEHLKLKKVHFEYNGKADLTIKGEQQTVGEQPYSYGVPQPAAAKAKSTPRSVRTRTTIRYAGLALAIGGCAVGLWGTSEYPHARERFDQINTPGTGGALLYTSAEWDAAKQTRDRDLAALIVGWGVSAIGVAGFMLTFTF